MATPREGRIPGTSTRPLLQRTKASQEVADHIAVQILDGTLAADTRVDLDAIADALGVSRIPVREALSRLEQEGLVHSRFYRGFYVEPVTAATIRENFQLYGLLASLAVRIVVERNDADEVNRLVAAGKACCVKDISVDEYSRRAYVFRREVHLSGAGIRLRHTLAGFGTVLRASSHFLTETSVNALKRTLRAEVKALGSGDPDLASRATFEHLKHNGDLAVSALVALGSIQEPDERPADVYARAVAALAAGRGSTA